MGSKTVDDHSGKDLTSVTKERYPPKVITQTSVALVFVEVNNQCIFVVLSDFSFSPEFFEETCLVLLQVHHHHTSTLLGECYPHLVLCR